MMRTFIRASAAALAVAALTGLCGVAQAQSPAALSDEQIGRLENVLLAKGTAIGIPVPVIDALHLSSAQVAPSVRQVTIQRDDGVKHGFAFLNDGSGYFLFRRDPDAQVAVFRVDKAFHLQAAAQQFGKDKFLDMAAAAAQAALDDEIRIWFNTLAPTDSGTKGAGSTTAPAAAPK